MHVSNVLRAARWKYRTQKLTQKFAICAPSHNFVELYLCNQGTTYRQSEKKLVKQNYLLQMSSQYSEPRPSNGLDLFGSLGHPSKFQPVSRLGFFTAATSLTGGQPNLARRLAVYWAGTIYTVSQKNKALQYCP